MSKATQILISELHQPIWGPMTSVLHLKTDDQGTGVGKIPQMSQPGVAVHPPLSSPEAPQCWTIGWMETVGCTWQSQKVFLMS